MNDEIEEVPGSSESETTPEEPILSLPSDDVPPPASEPVVPPVEVISVDELLDRLAQSVDESEETGELEAPAEVEEAASPLEDIPVEPSLDMVNVLQDLATKAAEMIVDMKQIEEHTREIEKDTGEIQMDVDIISQTVNHPALTTSFAEYTVTEALLLFLLLSVFIAACARMLRGGLSWLRS